jgi:hypothetical protein
MEIQEVNRLEEEIVHQVEAEEVQEAELQEDLLVIQTAE